MNASTEGRNVFVFSLVPFKRLDAQREPVHVGEHPDGDLRVDPPFLTESGLPEPVTLVGLVVERLCRCLDYAEVFIVPTGQGAI